MINKPFVVIPIAKVLEETNSCFDMHVRSASALMELLEKQSSNWLRLDNWEGLTDTEIFGHLVKIKAPSGRIYVISEVSYRNDLGAFSIDASQMTSFIADHLANFGECLFNGDALFVSIERRAIWAFHHEGVYTSYEP